MTAQHNNLIMVQHNNLIMVQVENPSFASKTLLFQELTSKNRLTDASASGIIHVLNEKREHYMTQTNYTYDDGGRVAAGMKSQSDCGIRAIAIAIGMEYHAARKFIRAFAKAGKQGNGQISNGIYKEDMNAALESIGWVWCSAPKFEGRKARYSDIPGTAILRMARHYSIVKDGVLYDSWDSSHKMVYGYWAKRRSV